MENFGSKKYRHYDARFVDTVNIHRNTYSGIKMYKNFTKAGRKIIKNLIESVRKACESNNSPFHQWNKAQALRSLASKGDYTVRYETRKPQLIGAIVNHMRIVKFIGYAKNGSFTYQMGVK